jgi:amidase
MGDPGMLQEFVLSRTVRDSAFMLDLVSRPILGDPYIIVQPNRPYAEEVHAPVEKLRIAWTTNSWLPEASVDSEVIHCVEQVVSECRRQGHELVEESPSFDYEEYLRAVCSAWAFGMYAGMDMFAAANGQMINEENIEPLMMSFYKYSKKLTGSDMILTEFALNKFRRSFGEFFKNYDVLLTPTLMKLPERLGRYTKMRTDIDYIGYMRLCDEARVHTTAANVTGQPAITLPLGQSRSGLPIGVQFMARFGEEGTLIRLASSLEKEMSWHDRMPPVHTSR